MSCVSKPRDQRCKEISLPLSNPLSTLNTTGTTKGVTFQVDPRIQDLNQTGFIECETWKEAVDDRKGTCFVELFKKEGCSLGLTVSGKF
ncbi:uncharacterized protein LOC106176282 isoform X1 [Lingula anatina]|uniref:Uncharacterized protein LOC106176282 isoform X1 n=1 Tax=Lingula anatina TaxID=7574 RepID=A0A1S3JUQ3_LINAN|nr:uncharacterized protein LOC106176282 isoform X1 [Lingula anatina]|eukprot:XP_013414058.1 uncharacterized protein LOC106176282 isoform X1 [Lingula anatina]